jgi:hypothetical protein
MLSKVASKLQNGELRVAEKGVNGVDATQRSTGRSGS